MAALRRVSPRARASVASCGAGCPSDDYRVGGDHLRIGGRARIGLREVVAAYIEVVEDYRQRRYPNMSPSPGSTAALGPWESFVREAPAGLRGLKTATEKLRGPRTFTARPWVSGRPLRG